MSETRPTTDTDPVFCDECNTAVRMARNSKTNSLKLECACGDAVNVRVAALLPDGWQP